MQIGFKLTIILLLVFLLTACSFHVGAPYNADKIDEFIPHQTTINQAIAALGVPQERERAPDGSERLLYFYFVPRDDAANPKSQGTYIYFDSVGRFLRVETSRLIDRDACNRSACAIVRESRCPAWLEVVRRRLSNA